MAVTAQQFDITDEELSSSGGSSYADIEVNQDYEAVLDNVEDYKASTVGWVFTFRISGLPFKVWVSHSKASRWKLIEVVHAFRPGWFEVKNEDGTTRPIDPSEWIGESVGAHVVLDEGLDTPRKIIQSVFSLEEEAPDIEDVPVL